MAELGTTSLAHHLQHATWKYPPKISENSRFASGGSTLSRSSSRRSLSRVHSELEQPWPPLGLPGSILSARVPLAPCLPLVWIIGLLFIWLSFSTTWELQRLAGCHDSKTVHCNFTHSLTFSRLAEHVGEEFYSVMIFTAPRPLEGTEGERQLSAILSWLRLHPSPQVVLMGRHPSFHALAEKYPMAIAVEEEVDSSFLGPPLFHSMIGRARAAKADVAVVVSPDVVLLHDFSAALEKVRRVRGDWLLASAQWELPNFPFELREAEGRWHRVPDGAWLDDDQVADSVREQGQLLACQGPAVLAWNTAPTPLHSGATPPFVLARQPDPAHWLLSEAIESKLRRVIDASDAITAVHIPAGSAHMPPAPAGIGTAPDGVEGGREHSSLHSGPLVSSLQDAINGYLAVSYGSFSLKQRTLADTPFELVFCEQRGSGGLCFLQRGLRPCRCAQGALNEHLPPGNGTLLGPAKWNSQPVDQWEAGQQGDVGEVASVKRLGRLEGSRTKESEEGGETRAGTRRQLLSGSQAYFTLPGIAEVAHRRDRQPMRRVQRSLQGLLEDEKEGTVGKKGGKMTWRSLLREAKGVAAGFQAPRKPATGQLASSSALPESQEGGGATGRAALEGTPPADQSEASIGARLAHPVGLILSASSATLSSQSQGAMSLADAKAASTGSSLALSQNRTSTPQGRSPRPCKCQDGTEGLEAPCAGSKLPKAAHVSRQIGLPFSLEQLLEHVASPDGVVVLAAVARNYLELLMSWVCSLRRLQVANFLVSALDEETYRFATMQGLPVFRHNFTERLGRDNCHFGTTCFQTVTKQKSRLVVRILQLGYHVLFSDVDVYWFHNPLPEFRTFPPTTLLVQSDNYNDTGPDNEIRRINSGFYFAQSHPAVITAFERIVAHAAHSSSSEQPSFYHVLCGEAGAFRVGSSHCVQPGLNLTVHFLSRERYPNGATQLIWQKENAREWCRAQGCVVLHNNWVAGRRKKLARQIARGLWDYDMRTRTCLYSWHGPNNERVF